MHKLKPDLMPSSNKIELLLPSNQTLPKALTGHLFRLVIDSAFAAQCAAA
jgi:hypothetical protein